MSIANLPGRRHQLSAYSPLPVRAVAAGLLADAGVGAAAASRLTSVLQRRYRARGVVLTGSGAMALQLALVAAVRARCARAIAIPAFSCFEVASAAVGAAERVGVRLRAYDVDPETLSPDWESFARALQGSVVAVVAPLFGVPIDWDRVRALADASGATVIEDAAQGHGASWREAPLGALGDLSVVSFGRGKGWTGIGGGALLARGAFGGEPIAVRRARGRLGARAGHAAATIAQCLLGRPSLYGIPAALPWLGLGETHYRDAADPVGMSAGASALLLASLPAADREAAVRRIRGSEWAERLPGVGRVTLFPVPADAKAGYLRFPVRVPGGLPSLPDPARARRAGIAPTYPSTLLALAPVRALLDGAAPACPGAEALVRETITLPTHGRLSRRDVEEVIAVLAQTPRRAAPRADRSTTPKAELCAESRVS